MGWVQNKDGFVLANDGKALSDIANIVGADGEIYHVQNVGRILAHCAEMRKGKGYSESRNLKRLASIPLIEYLKNPGLSDDDAELERYLSRHPEYRTAHETGGLASPNIIVK